MTLRGTGWGSKREAESSSDPTWPVPTWPTWSYLPSSNCVNADKFPLDCETGKRGKESNSQNVRRRESLAGLVGASQLELWRETVCLQNLNHGALWRRIGFSTPRGLSMLFFAYQIQYLASFPSH